MLNILLNFQIIFQVCLILYYINADFIKKEQQNQHSQQFIDYIEDDDDDYMPNMQISYINQAFSNKNTFTCQSVKNILVTGISGANISPENIDVIAVMGDALSTGAGLWPGTDIEFRGAVFTTGGDANIDGLLTFANILYIFNPKLEGASHGMGSSDMLSYYQFNVAKAKSESDDMEKQSLRLIKRFKLVYNQTELESKWFLIFITIGTEETCTKCDEPNMSNIKNAIINLKDVIPKALVVLIGPIHVAKYSQLTYNLLKPRCRCLKTLSNAKLRALQKVWRNKFNELEAEFTKRNYLTFSVLTIPLLIIESRYPEQLFIPDKPLLNRRGHSYASKCGNMFNASKIPISRDSYYCPSLACPFFRTPQNKVKCTVMTQTEYNRLYSSTPVIKNVSQKIYITGGRANFSRNPIIWIIVLIILCIVTVIGFGTIFYFHGMNATKSRFEILEKRNWKPKKPSKITIK